MIYLNKDRVPGQSVVVWPLVVTLFLIASTLVLPEFVPDVFRGSTGSTVADISDLRIYDAALLLLGIPLFVLQIIMLGLSLIKIEIARSISCALGACIILVSVLQARSVIEGLQIAKMHVFKQQFVMCQKTAMKYSESGRFKLCSIRAHGNSIWSMVYDSGGEINLPPSRRTSEFTAFVNLEIGPILSECDVRSRHVLGSFYLVTSVCG